jgi:hypothetical protein
MKQNRKEQHLSNVTSRSPNNQPRFTVAFLVMAAICFAPTGLALADTPSSQTLNVSGTIQENLVKEFGPGNSFTGTGIDTLTGDLEGTGVLHITCPIGHGTCSEKRIIFASQGYLFLDEAGTESGSVVTVLSTVTGGTGLFKNATGQLNLQGEILGNGVVIFTYTGTLTLAN